MKTNPEIEVTFYAKVGDPAGLSSADHIEVHDQLEARLLDEGNKIRTRKTSVAATASTVYEFTAKRKNPEQSSENEQTISDTVECTAVVNEDFFNTFMTGVAEQRMVKTRYYFRDRSITLKIGDTLTPIVIEHVGFEVDMFTTRGTPCEYVKIDVEVDPILDYMKEHFPEISGGVKLTIKTMNLPFKPIDMIYKPVATEEQKAIIADLWDNHYTLRRQEYPMLTI